MDSERAQKAIEYGEIGIVLLIGAGVAIALWWLVSFLLSRPGVQERHWAKALRKPLAGLVFWGVVLRTFTLAAHKLDYLSANREYAEWMDRTVALAWLAFAVCACVRFLSAVLGGAPSHPEDRVSVHRRNMLRKIATGIAVVLGILVAFNILGVNTAPFLAGGAIGGVIIGLALQEGLSNVFSGIMFSLDEAIREGDLIRFDDGKEGFVRQIGWRATTVRLWNNTLLVVPNSQMSSDQIVNLSRPQLPVTLNVDVGVAYGSKLEQVEALCIEAAKQIQAKYSENESLDPPATRWQGFGDSSMNIRVFVQVRSAEVQYAAKSDLIKLIYNSFNDNGIDIPFPIRTLDAPELVAALSGAKAK